MFFLNKSKNKESSGTMIILIVAVFWGMFPILVNKGSQHFQPIFFGASSIIVGGITALILSLLKKDIKNIFNRKAFPWAMGVALFTSTLSYGIMFIGSKLTSGINTSALMLSEIIFTILITPFFGEKTTLNKILGGVLVLVGALIILFKGGDLNFGDFLVIICTVFLPFGNYFGKKALEHISPENLLALRYLFSGIFLLLMSFIFEDSSKMLPSLASFWPYVAVNGILFLGLVNSLWYKGLKKLPISKAVFLLMTYPIFSLIFLVVFYKEIPNLFQVIGVFIIVSGAYFSAKISGK
jgi:drug/metabolite transporter (DMT)-like permease